MLKRKRVAYLHYALGLDYLDQGKTQMAKEHLWKAICAKNSCRETVGGVDVCLLRTFGHYRTQNI